MNESQLQDIQNRQKQTGIRGEDFVLAYEKNRLRGHKQIAMVRIVGRSDVGLGYDITSLNSETSCSIDRYIEVKTYSGTPHFFLSAGESAAARKYRDQYFIYLVDETSMLTPDYEPIIIRDPAKSISASNEWQQHSQSTEYTLSIPKATLPKAFDDSTVMIGCFNDNNHLSWIRHSHCYNVRANLNGMNVNGAVIPDEIAMRARYLVLYNVQSPRIYAVYSIEVSTVVTNAQLRVTGYRNPHCPYYILYSLKEKITLPTIDIMQLLRTNNDKVQRTSGTPVYMLGSTLKRYFTDANVSHGMAPPQRGYSNDGKPWTKVQEIKLTDWLAEGKDIGFIAQKLYRNTQDVHAKIAELKKYNPHLITP